MTYHVTARDIVHGRPQNPQGCAVYRAISRRHPTKRVCVGSTMVNIGDSQYNLSARVWRWIDRFDQGQAVRPMRFELL